MSDAPKRKYQLTLTLGGDDIQDIVHGLEQISFDLMREANDDIEAVGYHSISGGYSSGWIVDVSVDPAMNHDEYMRLLKEHVAQEKEAK